jgi:hypothetical protein
MKTQDQLRKELDLMQKQKEEQAEIALKQAKANILAAKQKAEQPQQPTTNPIGKQQGQPKPPTPDKQQKRLDNGVSKNMKGKARNLGGPRVPKENKGVKETAVEESEVEETDTLMQEPAAHPQHIVPSEEYKSESDQSTGGNYGPQGYYNVVIGKGNAKVKNVKVKYGEGDYVSSFVNPLSDKEIEVVRIPLEEGIAGYATDGTKIYIDDAVPNWMYLGLITHETFEMALVETLGMSYEWSHVKATELEKETVESLGIKWKQYDDEYKLLLKFIALRSPRPKNPEGMHSHGKGGSGGMDSSRLGHSAQEDTGAPLMGRTELQYEKDKP